MQRLKTNRLFLLLIAATLPALVVTSINHAEEASGRQSSAATQPVRPQRSLTRDEKLYLLESRQAQLALDQAKAEMDQAKVELDQVTTLFEEKLVTIEKLNEASQKYERAKLAHEQAKIELRKKRLEFLKDATLITVVDAKKYRGKEGTVLASVRIRNDSDINKARIAMEGAEQDLSDEDLASLLKVDNVIVTLKGEVRIRAGAGENERFVSSGKAIIGEPFQQIVPELRHGQEIDLEYRLIKKDVDNVTVSLEFLGIEKDYDVFLRKESQEDLPTISSTQYSQVGQLGSKILYDLTLERLAKTEASFTPVILNLPAEKIKASLLDPSSQAILTSIRFTEELDKQNLYLELSIPEKLDPKLVGESITFYVLVTRRSELKHINEIRTKYKGVIPPEELAKLKGNKVELELIPRGVGKLEIMIPNLFKEIEQGDPVTIKFRVMNSGTLALRRVTPELDLPLEWEGKLVPRDVEAIKGGDKALFTAQLNPPEDVAVGEYTVKIKAEGHSGVEIVDALDKDFTVRVASRSSITGTAILVAVLIVLVIGIAIASIKISRR